MTRNIMLTSTFQLAELPAVKAAQAAEGVTAVTETTTWNTIKTQFYLNVSISPADVASTPTP